MHSEDISGTVDGGVAGVLAMAAPLAPENSIFDPRGYFLGLAQRAAVGGKLVRIDLGDMGEVLIDPERQLYSSTPIDPEPFFRAAARSFRYEEVRRGEVEWPHAGRDLGELLWTAAYYASAGRLPVGCSKFDVIQLAYWPNFSRLPADNSALRLCSLFCKRPRAVNVARNLLRLSEAEVYRFYSAAFCSGAVEVLSSVPASPQALADKVAGGPLRAAGSSDSLLRLLWKKLSRS